MTCKDARLRGFELQIKNPNVPRSVILTVLQREGFDLQRWGLILKYDWKEERRRK